MTEISEVRLADLKDKEQLMELCRLYWSENAMFPPNEAAIEDLVLACVTHEPTPGCLNPGMIGVIERDDRIVAMIALRVTQVWYSRQPVIEDILFFVHPDHRRSDYAKLLITYAKYMADELGLPMMMGVISNIRTEAKVRLYRRQLPFCGAFFVYTPDSFIESRKVA